MKKDSKKDKRSRSWKNELGRIAAALSRKGVQIPEILSVFENADVDVPQQTLRRWIRRSLEGAPAVSPESPPGRAPSLSREECTILSGYILDCNSRMKEVHASTVFEFVHEYFGYEIDARTALNYLHRLGFSDRAERTKVGGFSLNYEDLGNEAYAWLRKHTFVKSRTHLCSIDFLFTSHRTDRRRTFAPTGSPQPKAGPGFPRYTNCVVTCLWADGRNRTPPTLFTYDPKMRRRRRGGQRQADYEQHFDDVLARYAIAADRIVYIGKDKGENRTYVSESPNLLRRFFGKYGTFRSATVLSDDGNSFSEKSKDVLLELGFRRHITYTPAVHMFLSPSDNGLHGPARKAWRELDIDKNDDVESSVAMLGQLDRFMGSAERLFKKCLIIRDEPITLAAARDLVGPPKFPDSALAQNLDGYRICAGLPLREGEDDVPPGLDSGLDGPRWN